MAITLKKELDIPIEVIENSNALLHGGDVLFTGKWYLQIMTTLYVMLVFIQFKVGNFLWVFLLSLTKMELGRLQ